ncbi:ankyrin [Lojkania enalia]|uniref:Ankyrin n=1 Tax=Lojkania enalia TaxID=147567 RepID=A0A9P4K5Y2_9PLEO|nr:ankyrin [Didymosphaeria enalia]
MVVSLVKATWLKPEIRLAQATSQFEADLSNDQKNTFRNYRSQSLDSAPTHDDVMRFTAEIDRRISKASGRCFGPRFTNFLQAVQQFAALGDIIVGGSQNIIASGVWSLVHLKAFQSELDIWVTSIKEEVTLLMAKKTSEEAQENSRFRTLSGKLSKTILHQQRLATNLRVLDFCSKYDYQTTWKQTRKIGNTMLFSHSIEYEKWKNSTSSCTILCTGKLGSGKSVLLANIVDNLHVQLPEKIVPIAFFFCRQDITQSLEARTILGSLARQLLRTLPDLSMLDEMLRDDQGSVENVRKITNLIIAFFPIGYKAYVIIDGLDECDDSERNTLVQELKRLQETFRLLLCISYRAESHRGSEESFKQFASLKVISIPEVNPEIETYIQAELEQCLASRRLILGEPTLILEIQDALLKGSQGMFLWVVLQIQSLCAMKTDQDIRDALEDLPNDLSETYSRILRRSGQSARPYQSRVLQLITVAIRPLTLEEIREALSVVPGDNIWNPSKFVNDIYSTLACCGCLLTIDEEEETIRFVHHSLRQFLLAGIESSSRIQFTLERAHREMADIIVTYLSYGIFETALSMTKIPEIIVCSAPSTIVRSISGPISGVQNIALKLLRSRKQPNFDMTKTLVETLPASQSQNHHFYVYAVAHWLHHILYVSGKDKTIYNLLERLLEGDVLITKVSVDDIWKPLKWAFENNKTIMDLLINRGRLNPNSRSSFLWTPLMKAARRDDVAGVKLLLAIDEVDVNALDIDGWTPLNFAVNQGNLTIVQLLLDKPAIDVNTPTMSSRRTPLTTALIMERMDIVRLLLDTGKIDLSFQDNMRCTALRYATTYASHDVIARLLQMDTEKTTLNIEDQWGQTPLLAAVKRKSWSVVKLLLETGYVYANTEDKEGELLFLVAEGHTNSISKLLLYTGGDYVDLVALELQKGDVVFELLRSRIRVKV